MLCARPRFGGPGSLQTKLAEVTHDNNIKRLIQETEMRITLTAVLLYFMLCARPPFGGPGSLQTKLDEVATDNLKIIIIKTTRNRNENSNDSSEVCLAGHCISCCVQDRHSVGLDRCRPSWLRVTHDNNIKD